MTVNPQNLSFQFQKYYGREPRLFRAPGRVNLIGEHTDYNGGFVLPMAIESESLVAAALRNNRIIRVRSLNVNEEFEFDLDEPEQKLRDSWIDYVEGVARILERNGVKLKGVDLLVYSNVPTGAGLSSSAALEISVGLAMLEISEQVVDKARLALAGQSAEHEFVGANVGIMDQFVSAMGKRGYALLIDCRNLTSEQVPIDLSEFSVVICDSKVKHNLSDSGYNMRRRECEEGVKILQEFLPEINELRDVSIADFEKHQAYLPEVIKKRCRHVITENERTLKAAKLLKAKDLIEFGRLMNLSHKSMRDDFEISCVEIDLLVETAQSLDGVLGSRMTGGGFGGSTVSLVKSENLSEFIDVVSKKYVTETSIQPAIYVSKAEEGACEIL